VKRLTPARRKKPLTWRGFSLKGTPFANMLPPGSKLVSKINVAEWKKRARRLEERLKKNGSKTSST